MIQAVTPLNKTPRVTVMCLPVVVVVAAAAAGVLKVPAPSGSPHSTFPGKSTQKRWAPGHSRAHQRRTLCLAGRCSSQQTSGAESWIRWWRRRRRSRRRRKKKCAGGWKGKVMDSSRCCCCSSRRIQLSFFSNGFGLKGSWGGAMWEVGFVFLLVFFPPPLFSLSLPL